MYNLKDMIFNVRKNFEISKKELQALIIISCFLGLGIASNGFNTIFSFFGTVNHLFSNFAICFLVFAFFLFGIKLYASIARYKAEFSIGLIGNIVLFFLLIFTNGNLILASILFLVCIGVEAFYFILKAKPEGRILSIFQFKFTSIEHKRINLDKDKRSLFSDYSWMYFFGYISLLLLYTIITETPNFVAGNFYAGLARNFILWFMVYFLLPIPPFPGFYMIFSSRTMFVFMISFIGLYLILLNLLNIVLAIVLAILLGMIIIYFYHYYYEIYM